MIRLPAFAVVLAALVGCDATGASPAPPPGAAVDAPGGGGRSYRLEAPGAVVQGRVVLRDEQGPPGFGESPDDPVVRVPVLELAAPLIVEAAAGGAGTKRSVDALQLAGTGARDVGTGCRRIRGRLFAAETGHHYTPVLIEVAAAEPADGCGAAPQSGPGGACRGGSFEEAWPAFREDLARRDCATLRRHARLPLHSHGVLDDDATRAIGRDGFDAACARWLDADAGLPRPSQPLAAYAASEAARAPSWRLGPGIEDQARVGALLFRRDDTDGCWRWTDYHRR
ncbi:DUF4431 domain-containing protein [Coralloluteibacterium stylophorae]|uniref:DUF4431 domain-containing protein n=1 Tax=Coralloluteibacterium stylophorae TaxID=1776034 RepID=A0A8J8AXE3_9GAMM|nr:DUF4431 domain-containing protein [Coralloluteibacterium stylophorae]MBS7455735.1 DUF4431 domain-containing protein [Coralloluteibacterium stylophorae]